MKSRHLIPGLIGLSTPPVTEPAPAFGTSARRPVTDYGLDGPVSPRQVWPWRTRLASPTRYAGKRRVLSLSESFTATQGTVDPALIAHYVANPGVMTDPGGQASDPVILSKDGRLFVMNGHHRLIAARIRGDSDIRCRVIDL